MTIKLSEKVEKDVSISMHIARFSSFSKDSQVVSLALTQKRTSKGPVLVTAAIGSAIIVRTSTEMRRHKHHSCCSNKTLCHNNNVKQKVSEEGEKAASIPTHMARFFLSSKNSQVVSLAQTQKRTSKGPALFTAELDSAVIVRTSTEMTDRSITAHPTKKTQSSIIGVKQKNDNSIEAHILGNSGVGIRGICAENSSHK